MATATAQEILSELNETILKVLKNGQALTSEGYRYTKADLDTLKQFRRELQAEISGSSSIDQSTRLRIMRPRRESDE